MRVVEGAVLLACIAFGVALGDWLSSGGGQPVVEQASAPTPVPAKPVPATEASARPVPEPRPVASRPSGPLSAADCAQKPEAAERRACFKIFFAGQPPMQSTAESLAIVEDWRINTRRLKADRSSRVLIRTASLKREKREKPQPRYLYASCRDRTHSLWLELDGTIANNLNNIPVDVSIDGKPARTFLFSASDKANAVGIWENDLALSLLDGFEKAKTVTLTVHHGELAKVTARFDTTTLPRALEPVDVACS